MAENSQILASQAVMPYDILGNNWLISAGFNLD
jgi:hypothetical protein